MMKHRLASLPALPWRILLTVLALFSLASAVAQEKENPPRAAQRVGEAAVPFDGGFGHPVYPLSDAKLCPGGATHTYSYTREFSIAGDMLFTCRVHPQNENLSEIVVYDKDFRLTFRNAAGAARLGGAALREPQFSQSRRVLFARDGLRIYELDPWNRKNRLFADFRGLQFTLPGGRTVRAGDARDFKVGPGDALVIELGAPRRVLNPGVRDCPDCFEVLGVATFDPATGKVHALSVRDEKLVPRWPKVGGIGFDESNLTQDQPPRVFLTIEKRPSWSFALDFSDAVEFRHPSFGPHGNPTYQWSAHGHPGFFCASNRRCYVVKPLTDIVDDDGDGTPDRVGSVGASVGNSWRGLFQLANAKTGQVELIWGSRNPERQFSGGHFSRSLLPDVFFGSGAKHEGNTITRYTVRYDPEGKPVEVVGENLARSESEIRCGYWAHPRATSSDDGMRALFDSTLAGRCQSHVYVVVARTPPAQQAASADKQP
jgi:hypothetical protein